MAEERSNQKSANSVGIMYKLLDCSTVNMLANDLAPFCTAHNLNLPSMMVHNPSWNLLIELFDELNRIPAAERTKKIFILDDVEHLNHKDGVLNFLNEICKRLSDKDEKYKGFWKFIVTTQKSVSDGPSNFKAIGDNFVVMNGFCESETRLLFRAQQGVDGKLIDRFMEQLGRSPLALSIAVRHLASNQVGGCIIQLKGHCLFCDEIFSVWIPPG